MRYRKLMCYSPNCLGYLLLLSVLFFAAFLAALLFFRRWLLKKDFDLSPKVIRRSLKESEISGGSSFIFSTWQDGSVARSLLIFRNDLGLEITRIEFVMGSREFSFLCGDQTYLISVNLTWGGSSFSLQDSAGNEVAQLSRASFSPRKHQVSLAGIGIFKSKQPLFSFKAPIEYRNGDQLVAVTELISPIRKIGRAGYFTNEVPLPIQIFILALSS